MDGDISVVCNDVVEAPLKQMISVCAWCKRELGRRWTTHGGISHGICDECRAKLMKDREGGKADVQLSAMSGKICDEVSLNQRGPRHYGAIRPGVGTSIPIRAGKIPGEKPELPLQGCRLPLVI